MVAVPDVAVAAFVVSSVVVASAGVVVAKGDAAMIVGSVDTPALVGVGLSDGGTGVAAVTAGLGVPMTAGRGCCRMWTVAPTEVAGAAAAALARAGVSRPEHTARPNTVKVVATEASHALRCVSKYIKDAAPRSQRGQTKSNESAGGHPIGGPAVSHQFSCICGVLRPHGSTLEAKSLCDSVATVLSRLSARVASSAGRVYRCAWATVGWAPAREPGGSAVRESGGRAAASASW